jgi:hypothetical protein
MEGCLHVELGKTDRAESVAAVDHNPWNVMLGVVILLAESTLFLVEQLAHKLVYLVSIEIGRIFGLLKEEGCWVFKLFHLIQKIITTIIDGENNYQNNLQNRWYL